MLVAVKLEAIRIAHQRPRLDTQQGIVGDGVVLMRVVQVVGGQQRGTDCVGDFEQLRVAAFLLGNLMILEFDEEVVLAEDVLQARCSFERLCVVALQQGLLHMGQPVVAMRPSECCSNISQSIRGL